MTCRWWGATGVVAAAVVAGLFFAPGVALADPQTRIPSAPCQPGGVAPSDTEIAGRLRPLMNGVRLGSSLTGYSVSCARAIVSNVQTRGLEQRAAVIAVATAITESTLHNYTRAVDKDSLGLFQQRPSQGWGRPGQLVDPRFATNAFLSSMIRKHPGGAWRAGDIGSICQRVQRSAYPAAYTPEVHDAQLLVTTLWPHVAAALATGKGTPTGTPSRTVAKGPFQRSLFTAATSQGPADARHDFLLADWNGDQRPDLFVVQRSGTVTGGTTVSIFDGRSTLPTAAMNFQRPLLQTGTVLGATDDRYAFSVADWNTDGRPDLIVTQRSGTASGRTELSVIDGASNFQRYLLQTATILAATDKRYDFAVGDWNTDGRLDLVVVERSAGTNVRIIDGASNFQRFLLETPTVLGPADDSWTFSVADQNTDGRLDLVAVHRSRQTELRVLSGARNFQRYLVKSGTALGATDDKYAFATTDWNDDGRLDLLSVRRSGAPSGRAEAQVLAG